MGANRKLQQDIDRTLKKAGTQGNRHHAHSKLAGLQVWPCWGQRL